jgi:hypothetical protein
MTHVLAPRRSARSIRAFDLSAPDGTYYQVNPNKVNLRLSTCKSATA